MRRATGLLVVAAGLSAGCGGGSPLLHPARVLPSGEVRASGGMSANIVPGSLSNALTSARANAASDPTAPGARGSNPTFAKGALVAAMIAPGLAPFVSARVGVGQQFEGGLAYTGRTLRVDMRRAFGGGPWTYSIGVGASAALYGRQQGSDLPNVDLAALHGYGADIPFLAGWQSPAGLYELWFGPRIGLEHDVVSALTSEPGDVIGAPIRLEATRLYGGALGGFAVGFKHVHVALELSVSYQTATGSYNATNVSIHGLDIAPGTALWFTF